jgi:sulfur carrier protein
MKLIVNDDTIDLPDGASVRDLLAHLGLAEKPCAVEVNKHVVPRRDHEQVSLQDGDRVEIVTLVGGG